MLNNLPTTLDLIEVPGLAWLKPHKIFYRVHHGRFTPTVSVVAIKTAGVESLKFTLRVIEEPYWINNGEIWVLSTQVLNIKGIDGTIKYLKPPPYMRPTLDRVEIYPATTNGKIIFGEGNRW